LGLQVIISKCGDMGSETLPCASMKKLQAWWMCVGTKRLESRRYRMMVMDEKEMRER